MFLSIYHNQSGEEYVRRLSPTEHYDLRRYVTQWVDDTFDGDARPSFSEPGSHIPNGCGDYQAEIRRTKASGSTCWTSEPFYIVWSDQA